MPSRWWVPLRGIQPEAVQLQHLHAVVSGWFDSTTLEHAAHDKPYAMSPLSPGPDDHCVGIEVGTLTPWAQDRLNAAAGSGIRLGVQRGQVGRPVPLAADTWESLARPTTARAWQIDLLTPTTFRTQGRSSPLPSIDTILGTLARLWEAWSDVPLPAADALRGAAWVSDLDLSSQAVSLPQRVGRGPRQDLTFSGSVGTLVVRSAHAEGARVTAPLLALANYAGIGSLTRKGFGVARTVPVRRSVEPMPRPALLRA